MPVDILKAKEYFEKAVEQSFKNAMVDLAIIYENGAPGIEPDFNKALEIYEKAAALDDVDAINYLGKCS